MPTLIHHQTSLFEFFVKHKYSLLHIIFYAIVLFAIGYRIFYITEYNPMDNIFSDPERHWVQGVDSLRFDPMAMTDPILYQLFVGMIAKVTLKDHALISFYAILLSIITPWIWYRFLRELHESKTVALLGWALLSLIPSWISIYAYFMQETLLLPLLGLALWSTWRCRRASTQKCFLAMVIFWVLAGLTRGVVIPMAAIACIWVWLEQGDKIPKAIYSLTILVLVLGPLAYRSYQIVHIFAPHGMGNMNVIYSKSGKRAIEVQYEREGARWGYIFQSPAAEARPFEPLSQWQSSRRGMAKIYIDLDKGSEDWKTASAKYPLTLENYLRQTYENTILLFFSESWPDSNRHWTLGEINYQTRWLWAPLTVFILILSIVYRQRLKKNMLLPSIIFTWFIVQCLLPISVNEGRYRMPLCGLIIVQGLLLLRRKHENPTPEMAPVSEKCREPKINTLEEKPSFARRNTNNSPILSPYFQRDGDEHKPI